MSLEAYVNMMAPPMFDGTNYLDANDQWEAVENTYEVPLLLDNRTIAQMKDHKESR